MSETATTREITTENEVGECKCKSIERKRTKSEQLGLFLEKAVTLAGDIAHAELPVHVEGNIEALESLMKTYAEIVPDLDEVKKSTDNMILNLRLHDYTRTDLVQYINGGLRESVEELIKEEVVKEHKARSIERFFAACAKHADEIAEILGNEDGIIG